MPYDGEVDDVTFCVVGSEWETGRGISFSRCFVSLAFRRIRIEKNLDVLANLEDLLIFIFNRFSLSNSVRLGDSLSVVVVSVSGLFSVISLVFSETFFRVNVNKNLCSI